MSYIDVTYEVYATPWHVQQKLREMNQYPELSFDCETRGVYSKAQRKEAVQFLKKEGTAQEHRQLALLVANNSGLSFPSLVNVTHFIFGISENHSIILIANYPQEEIQIWNWIARYEGMLYIHNTLLDLKLMYHRVRTFPQRYEDTQLLVKSLVNHVNVWKAKVGLKDLMGVYYHPEWALAVDYEPANLKDPKFLMYGAIDGAGTFKLYRNIEEHIKSLL